MLCALISCLPPSPPPHTIPDSHGTDARSSNLLLRPQPAAHHGTRPHRLITCNHTGSIRLRASHRASRKHMVTSCLSFDTVCLPSRIDALFRSQQHHRLPPAAAPSNVPGGVPPASAQRLNEFFDLIKQEFETVAQDSNIWKAQRDEYEAQRESICVCAQTVTDIQCLSRSTSWV